MNVKDDAAAINAAYAVLQKGLTHDKKGLAQFLDRAAKLVAVELVSKTGARGELAAECLNDVFVPVVEMQIMRLCNDPEVQATLRMLRELKK